MLPFTYHTAETYKIAPSTLLFAGHQGLESLFALDRNIFYGGPIFPLHLVRLTQMESGLYGTALFVDTKTGTGIELKEYGGRCPFYFGGMPAFSSSHRTWHVALSQ